MEGGGELFGRNRGRAEPRDHEAGGDVAESVAPAASASAMTAITVSPAPVTSATSRATAGSSPSTVVPPDASSTHIPCSPRVMSTLAPVRSWS